MGFTSVYMFTGLGDGFKLLGFTDLGDGFTVAREPINGCKCFW